MGKGGKPIEVLVEETARPLVEERGLQLVAVEVVKEGANRYLRVYIDREGGVTFEDCEAISRAVDSRLDEILPYPPYEYFEVSSPGLERPLKRDEDFARYTGHKVAINTYALVDGQKAFVGELLGLVDGNISIRLTEGTRSGQELTLGRSQIAGARLHVDL